ncbi:Uncharacterized protein FWK35_00021651 [Aphis craccivora]|uniref:Uncharacterized protein n=1 Tax=Aphis craccivora TaxID=307492 RepID=A0A6G0X9L4_APHCR|nr:Uncharacterized protein FWK35_00021651 [Aphis craccivora]
MDRNCLSGSEYRKRKSETDAKIKKQAGAIKKFFQQSTSQELTSNSGTSQVQETSFEISLSTDNLHENTIKLDALTINSDFCNNSNNILETQLENNHEYTEVSLDKSSTDIVSSTS